MNQIELEEIQRDFKDGNAIIHLHNIIYEDNGSVVNSLPSDAVLELSKIKEIDYSPSSGGMSTGMSTYDLIFNVGAMYEPKNVKNCLRFGIPGNYINKKVFFRIMFSDYCINEAFIKGALHKLLNYCFESPLNFRYKNGTIENTLNAFKYRHYYV